MVVEPTAGMTAADAPGRPHSAGVDSGVPEVAEDATGPLAATQSQAQEAFGMTGVRRCAALGPATPTGSPIRRRAGHQGECATARAAGETTTIVVNKATAYGIIPCNP